MSVTIGSNSASLKAQRYLGNATRALGATFERLSSGLRINNASDDAAGLAVSSSLNVDIRVYSQAVRNLNDGISSLQIADSSLAQLTGIVTRIKELAAQGANGIYNVKQRTVIDQEAQALAREYFRIIQTTEFNDVKLLNGSVDKIALQAGYGINGVLAAGVGGAIGTGTFKSEVSYNIGSQPFSVATGDLNGDGVIDMVTANLGGSSTSVLMGNGDGTFRSASTYSTGAQTRTVALGDINGDGVLDMLAACEVGGYISVFTGKGDGSFNSQTQVAVANGPEYITVADFNKDGFLDIGTNNLDNTVSVLLGNGNGSFSQSFNSAVAGLVVSHTTGDLNGDGIPDLISSGHTSTSYFLGRGDGTFGARTDLGNFATTSALVEDFTGDGILDILVGSNQLELFVGRGNGTFNAAIEVGPTPGYYLASAGDLNGDGILDVVGSDNNNGQVHVLIGRGNGYFNDEVSYSAGTGPRGIGLADFNGDGVLDLVATDGGASNTAKVFIGNSKDGTAPLIEFSLRSVADSRQAMGILDNALRNLANQRSVIGAFQGRIQTATNVVRTTIEAYSSASSRIQDADIGEETSRLIQSQILQRTASAVLAQINVQPKLAIKLLGG